MDWGVGPSGRERFAQALLTFMFFAPGDMALAALGPVRISSGRSVNFVQGGQWIAVGDPELVSRTARSRIPEIGSGAMESASGPASGPDSGPASGPGGAGSAGPRGLRAQLV